MDIKALAQDAAPYVVERRHYYHQHPELTGEEKNTRDAIHRDLELSLIHISEPTRRT